MVTLDQSIEGKIIDNQRSLAFIGITLLRLVQIANMATAKGFFPLVSHVFTIGAGLSYPECRLIYCCNK
jgi:hypothetical protein